MWYEFLNIFFFVFHTVLTVFNVVGWAFPQTRKLHLVTVLLTAGSWFVLGIWYGWGYCLCTDWHWTVREKLGYENESDSYIHFLILKLTGIDANKNLVDTGTLVIFGLSFVLSIILNLREWKRRKRKNTQ